MTACLVVTGEGVLSSPVDVLDLDFAGIVGDRHFGATRQSGPREPWYARGTVIRNDRQVSIVSQDELTAVARGMELSILEPAWIGANLVIDGLDALSELPPGTRMFLAAGATLKIEAANAPCRVAGRAIAAEVPDREGLDLMFPKIARHRRGLVASVEKPGRVCVGDAVRVTVPASAGTTGALL